MLVKKCGVCLDSDSTQLRTEVPQDLFFLNLVPHLLFCQECQEGIRRFSVCILGTKLGK
jgi:hypothetical protein